VHETGEHQGHQVAVDVVGHREDGVHQAGATDDRFHVVAAIIGDGDQVHFGVAETDDGEREQQDRGKVAYDLAFAAGEEEREVFELAHRRHALGGHLEHQALVELRMRVGRTGASTERAEKGCNALCDL